MFTLILCSGAIMVLVILYYLNSKYKGSYTAPYDRETSGERFEKKWNHFHSNGGCNWKKGNLTNDQKKFMNNFLDL